jgi:transposase
MIKLDRPDTPAAAEHATVYLAFELSKAKWKLGVLLPGSQKLSRYTIAGGDLTAIGCIDGCRDKVSSTMRSTLPASR